MDSDIYVSTYETLQFMYPKLEIGGYVFFDDFKLKYSREAIIDYRTKHRISEPWYKMEHTGHYFKGDLRDCCIDPMLYWQKKKPVLTPPEPAQHPPPPLLEPPLPGPAVAKDEAFISAMMRLGEEAGGGAAIGADQEPGQETDQGGGATEGQVSEVAVLGALVVLAAFAGGAMRRRHGARNV